MLENNRSFWTKQGLRKAVSVSFRAKCTPPSLCTALSGVLINVLRCQLTYWGQAETNAEAWFNIALRPRKPEGSLGRTAQDGHLDSHTAPELWICGILLYNLFNVAFVVKRHGVLKGCDDTSVDVYGSHPSVRVRVAGLV